MPTYVSKARDREVIRGATSRWIELIGLVLVSIFVAFGAVRVYRVKAAHPLEGVERVERGAASFDRIEQQIKEKQIIPLGEVTSWREIAPVLTPLAGDEQRLAAEAIFDYVRSRNYQLANVGELNNRLRDQAPVIRQIKPSLIVRRPADFTSAYWTWFGAMVAVFYLVHIVWRWAKFEGDGLFLPIIHLLCGIGFLMMVSLRDPLRDTLSFKDFSVGILAGSAGLIMASLSDRLPVVRGFKALFKKRPGVPLALALGLSLLLVLFGRGPGGSDAKVNLGPFQPVELIKILVVFYLAAYFDRHWEFLRFLHQKGSGLFKLLARFRAPRLIFFLPVVIAMAAVLIFFFAQKDLGPALVMAAVFLSLYAVARMRYALIGGGLAILLAGLIGAYWLGQPETVVKRIDIFRNVWENGLRGGDQIAHSLWAMSTGGVSGAGLGLGDPAVIPAGHTDLILSSVGEELGWIGIVIVLALYGVLIARSFRAAMRAATDYDLFLALGLALITAWQILLITTGILGLFPLSGVVSPFLSWGKSSMIANFLIMGLILAVSSRGAAAPRTEAFQAPVKWLGRVLALIALVVAAKAAYVQLFKADDHILRGVLVELRDGSYAFQYNRRLMNAARILKIGTIYDRNGVPLAAGDCRTLTDNREKLAALGVTPENVCKSAGSRLYPFGEQLFHLLGDLRTQANWAAKNTIYVERDYYDRLHGYDDHAEWVTVEIPVGAAALAKARRRSAAPSTPDVRSDKLDKDVLNDEGEDSNEAVKEGGKAVGTDDDGDGLQTEDDAIRPGQRTRTVRVLKRDYREVLPLLRHRYQPDHPAVQALLNKERNVRLSIDIRLQLKAAGLLAAKLRDARVKRGAAVVLDPATGDVLAAVSYPWPGQPFTSNPPGPGEPMPPREDWVDRAFTALRPPGSTFKIVTAMAALNRTGADFREQRFECEPLGGGRVGKRIAGFNRPVRDSEGDRAHGNPDLEAAIIESCNAYFAQLGLRIGAEDLKQTADKLEIKVAGARDEFNTVEELKKGENLLQGAYGQGRVVATPFQMARVAATVAGGGTMPYGRWVMDDSNTRINPPALIVPPDKAEFLIGAMRGVVTSGTARAFAASTMAGKTGTAQNVKRVRITENGKPGFSDKDGKLVFQNWKRGDPIPEGQRPAYDLIPQPSHGWFIGIAPYDAPRRIAFSVLIENGGFGGKVAAPIADEIVAEAKRLGLIQ